MTGEARNWSETAVLRDGGSILVRAVEPSDKELLRALFGRLSPYSVRHRFFGGKKALSPKELAYFTEVDFVHHVALAAILREDGEERMIGVARYICSPATATAAAPAEVAFAVVDAHQGRGIGSVLLEHLAAIAVASGVDELDAEVMADNAGMMHLFTQSGFTVRHTMTDAVYSVMFPTAATAAFVRACDERERHASAESLHVFFEPATIAVVGASARAGNVGGTIVRNLRRHGYTGRVHPVHPSAREIEGFAVASSIAKVEGSIDLAILAVPPHAVEGVIAECAQAGVHGIVVISRDVSERAVEQKALLRRLVRTDGMRMLGPSSLGVLRTATAAPMAATVTSTWPRPGPVSIFCESASRGVALLEEAVKRDIGIADFVSAGDKADVSGNDVLSYWASQSSTKVIALCLESFGNPQKFVRIASTVSMQKPIVVLTSCSLPEVDALFEAGRVLRADDSDQLFDILARLSPTSVTPAL